MDARARKLAVMFSDEEAAEKLVAAGLDTPRKIRAAKEADLKAAVGAAGLRKVRERFPKK